MIFRSAYPLPDMPVILLWSLNLFIHKSIAYQIIKFPEMKNLLDFHLRFYLILPKQKFLKIFHLVSFGISLVFGTFGTFICKTAKS